MDAKHNYSGRVASLKRDDNNRKRKDKKKRVLRYLLVYMSVTDDTSQLPMSWLKAVDSKNTVRVTNKQKQKSKKKDSEHDGGYVDNDGGDGFC